MCLCFYVVMASHWYQLTISSRDRSARNFWAHLNSFAASIVSYVRGIGDVTVSDREALREKWESGDQDASEEEDDEEPLDPFEAILGRHLANGLYSFKKPIPKVDAYGRTVGIIPRLKAVCTFSAASLSDA